jgi:hypothetical protein
MSRITTLLFALAMVPVAQAQVIRGTVIDASAATWLPEARVSALREGRVLASTTTDAGGRFALRLRDSSGVWIVLDRDGFQAESLYVAGPRRLPLRIALLRRGVSLRAPVTSGAAFAADAEAPEGPQELPRAPARVTPPAPAPARPLVPVERVTSDERSQCGPTGSITARAQQLLDAARGPLQDFSSFRDSLVVTIARTDVTRDKAGNSQESESNVEERAQGPNPDFALTPDSLAIVGYMDDASSTAVWRPASADLLLSPAFLAGHCIRAVAPRRGDSAAAGLAFEPTDRKRTTVDVMGVLWIGSDGGLRQFEYRYVNLKTLLRNTRAGGSETFRRVAPSRWVIDRWTLSRPIITQILSASAVVPGQRRTESVVERVTATWVTEGRAEQVWEGDRQLWAPGKVPGRFVVVDSLTATPVEGAVLYHESTAKGVTDSLGYLDIGVIAPGEQTFALKVPALAELGVESVTRSAVVPDVAPSLVTLTAPSVESIVRERCGTRVLEWGEAMLMSSVVPAADTVLTPGPVVVRWTIPHRVPGRPDVFTVSDDRRFDPAPDGSFTVCGVPRDATIELQYQGARHTVRLPASKAALSLPQLR